MVAEGYDRIAEAYVRQRERTPGEPESSYLGRTTQGLSDGARVLDLGCGAGVHSAYLAERFDLVGVDISRGQLVLAQRLVPNASFVLADMGALAFRDASFDAIVALYSIIHLPREAHEGLVDRIFHWLRPGGRLLAVVGWAEWEGRESDWLVPGVEMFWSHYGRDTYLSMFERLGLHVLESQIEPDSLDGAHLFVLAERPPG